MNSLYIPLNPSLTDPWDRADQRKCPRTVALQTFTWWNTQGSFNGDKHHLRVTHYGGGKMAGNQVNSPCEHSKLHSSVMIINSSLHWKLFQLYYHQGEMCPADRSHRDLNMKHKTVVVQGTAQAGRTQMQTQAVWYKENTFNKAKRLTSRESKKLAGTAGRYR